MKLGSFSLRVPFAEYAAAASCIALAAAAWTVTHRPDVAVLPVAQAEASLLRLCDEDRHDSCAAPAPMLRAAVEDGDQTVLRRSTADLSELN